MSFKLKFETLSAGKLKLHEPLSRHTTFKIGGPAKYFIIAKNAEEIIEAIKWAKAQRVNFKIVGGGSNILFSDDGYDGLVIKINNDDLKISGENLFCGAGLPLARALSQALNNNLLGLQWAVGIPGTIGGAIHNNAGAYGGELAQAVSAVKVLRAGKIIELTNHDCGFGYRESIFKRYSASVIPTPSAEPVPSEVEGLRTGSAEGSLTNERDFSTRSPAKAGSLGRNDNERDIILSATLKLKSATAADIALAKEKIKEILADRCQKFGSNLSAGSTFKNILLTSEEMKKFKIKHPELPADFVKWNKIPSAWLIDQCGLRGKKIGGAKVSENHAGIIINTGKATAKDIIMLISIIKQKVRRKFGLQLMEEVEYVGF